MSHHDLLEESAKNIEALETKKIRLLREVDEVKRELGHAKARHANIINRTAPVFKLPNEILANIFRISQGTWAVSRMHGKLFEVAATHVSAHWRAIALETPLLWNNISVRVSTRTQKRLVRRMSAFLMRSGQCLLNISILIARSAEVGPFIDAMIPHAKRWYRVSMSLAFKDPDEVYAPLRSVVAPVLVHLSLRVGDPKDAPFSRSEFPPMCPLILEHGAPSLSFARVGGLVFGNFTPPLCNVTTLHIETWSKNTITPAQFQSMLSAIPRLAHLSLTGLGIQPARDPLDISDPIIVPSLRSLRIYENCTPFNRLLTLMTLPKLDSLCLRGVHTFDSPVIPTMRTVTIEQGTLDETDLRNVVCAFPNVTTFTVDRYSRAIYTVLSSDAWPALDTIYQMDLPSFDTALFCNMLLQRGPGTAPLRRLCIDRCTRASLRSKEILENLKRLYLVEDCDEPEPWPLDLGYEDLDDGYWEPSGTPHDSD